MGALEVLGKLFGVSNDMDELEADTVEDVAEKTVVQEQQRKVKPTGGTLVSLPGGAAASAGSMQVVISEPGSLKDARDLADQLKNRRQVIINLENTRQDISQRIIDFISGTVHAIEGQSQQVGRYIFVFTPRNMEISKDERTENTASARRSTTAGNNTFFMPSDQNVEDDK